MFSFRHHLAWLRFFSISVLLLGVCVSTTGCSRNDFLKPLTPIHAFAKMYNRSIVDEYDKKVVLPAKQAREGFDKEYFAFCKKNTDVKLRLAQRAALGRKYLNKLPKLLLDNGEAYKDNLLLRRERLYANKYVRNVHKYLQASSMVLAKNPQAAARARTEVQSFYRQMFDAELEYEHYRSMARFKPDTYCLNNHSVAALKKGMSYFRVAGTFKMPGKLLSSDKVLLQDRLVQQQSYLWSENNAAVVVVFQNGRVSFITEQGTW